MEIVPLSAEHAHVVRWRNGDGKWQATVVCKVSYSLRPGVLQLAEQQVPIYAKPQHYEDGSLWAPSDLAPHKRRCDVLLVGHAYAPGGRATPQLTARLQLSSVDKSLRVVGAQLVDQRGSHLPPAAFRRMALRYHHAARGSGNENPIGVPQRGSLAPDGARSLPNVMWPNGQDGGFACFAPIAPDWPTRRAHVKSAGLRWLDDPARHGPMPADLQEEFFQCAPPDQQISFPQGDEPLTLTHLHPEKSQLSCSLPGQRVVAYAKARGLDPQEVPMVCDMILIDTDEQLCTLTWRGRLALQREPKEYRVLTLLAGLSEDPSYEEMHRRAQEPRSSQRNPEDEPTGRKRARRQVGIKSETNLLEGVVPRAALPFHRAPNPSSPPPEPPPPEPLLGAPWSHSVDDAGHASPPVPAVSTRDNVPPEQPNLDTTAAVPAARESAFPPSSHDSAYPAARDSVYPISETDDGSPAPPEATALSDTARLPPRRPPTPDAKPSAWSGSNQARQVRPAVVSRQPGQGAGGGGVLAAMDAARASSSGPSEAEPARRPLAAISASARARPKKRYKLLWFDPQRATDVRADPELAELLSDRELRLIEQGRDDELEGVAKDRGDVFELLVRSEAVPLSELQTRIEAATDEHGMFQPPLLVVAGELSFPFDPVARLRATVTVLTPLSLGDKQLRALIEEAEELLKAPWLEGSQDVADQLVARLNHETAARGKRGLPADVLRDRTEQLLLDQRAYQERKLYGSSWLRALIASRHGGPQLCYLPASLRDVLPLYAQFEARLLVELDLREEQGESCPLALKVLALARTLS